MAFIFHVIYGMSSFPFNIFQRGWNHQPVYNNNNNIMGLNVDVLFIGNHFGFIMVCYSLEIIMYIDVIKLGISYCLLFGQILSCFFWYVWHVETELLLETAISWASGMVTGQCPPTMSFERTAEDTASMLLGRLGLLWRWFFIAVESWIWGHEPHGRIQLFVRHVIFLYVFVSVLVSFLFRLPANFGNWLYATSMPSICFLNYTRIQVSYHWWLVRVSCLVNFSIKTRYHKIPTS